MLKSLGTMKAIFVQPNSPNCIQYNLLKTLNSNVIVVLKILKTNWKLIT